MLSLNEVNLIGNLVADPEVRNMNNGDLVTNLTIATNKRWKDKATGENREKAQYHRVILFRGQAKVAADWLKKGSQCLIKGELSTRKWTDKDGVDRYTTEVIANNLTLGNRPQGANNNAAPTASPKVQAASADFDADSCPF